MSLFTLYRFYAANNTLLYIGLTINPGRRMVEHQGTKTWWNEIASIELEQYPDDYSLRSAERAAIQIEEPRYNISMNDGPRSVWDPQILAEGCSEWIDAEGRSCSAPATHVGTPDYNGGILLCEKHTHAYTVAVRIPEHIRLAS